MIGNCIRNSLFTTRNSLCRNRTLTCLSCSSVCVIAQQHYVNMWSYIIHVVKIVHILIVFPSLSVSIHNNKAKHQLLQCTGKQVSLVNNWPIETFSTVMILVPCLDGQLQDQNKWSLSTSGLFTQKNGHCQQVAFLSGEAYCILLP